MPARYSLKLVWTPENFLKTSEIEKKIANILYLGGSFVRFPLFKYAFNFQAYMKNW